MNRIDESTLMAYLYGELEPQEHREVETQIELDPELATRLQELKAIRGLLGKLEDSHPETPLIINHNRITPIFKRLIPWLGAAAAILLMLLVGFIFETSISFEGRKLTVEFGTTTPTESVYHDQVLVPVIHDALQKQEQLLMDRMQKLQADLEQRMTTVAVQSTPKATEGVDETILHSQLQKYREQQLAEMTGLMEENIASQRERNPRAPSLYSIAFSTK